MRGRGVLFAAFLLCGSSLAAAAPPGAGAAARPTIAPAPEWVAPAAIPAAPPAAEGAATVDLLTDIQRKLTKDGDLNYYATVYKIASPQGLGDAAMQVNWDPALETLTLHRYQIRRDGKVLDLLGDGSKLSIIQREQNMENAALDGELTASMQPTDVRVGDVVELAFTRTRRDPAMGGRSEALLGPKDGTPYGRFRVRFVWPDGKSMRWRAFPGVLAPKQTHTSAGNELVADLSNITTPLPPRGAPSRFQLINAIDISEFTSWGEVASTLLPLYSAAGELAKDSPVRAEARRIAAATTDPQRRAEMALATVQEQIRYLFLGMDDGGYVPAAADLTWSRRFGDCKGKTVLLAALLRELGISAEPVLVQTERGDLVSDQLPSMGAFDHVIVRANIAGRTYWMDGTRLGDTRLDFLRTPPYHVGLPIVRGTTGLVPLTPEQLAAPSETLTLALDASAGIDAPAPAKGEMRFRGMDGTDMRLKYSGLATAERDQQLRDLWRKYYDFISPSSITTTVDDRTGDFVIAMTGTAKMDWYADVGTRWYEVDRSRLGWKFETDREGMLSKNAPFEIDYPDYWESRETIKLPAAGAGFKLQGGSVDQVIGGVYAFHRKVGIAGDLVTMESSTRALAPELPASKAEQTRSELSALSNTAVFVRLPDEYVATSADIAALQTNKTALAIALRHRGAVHFDRNELVESIADENAAIALEPENATAHAIRALALALQDDAKAEAAADRAIALDSKQGLAWRAKAVVAFNHKRYADADANFSKQIELNAEDAQALSARATTRLILGKFAESLTDAEAALAISPGSDVRMIRAAALAALGRKEEALAEGDRAVEGQPRNEVMRTARAKLRKELGRPDLARQDYDVLIAQTPKEEYFLARAILWPDADHSKRNDDIASALRLNPRSTKALAFRAAAGIESARFGQAETDIAAIEKIDPNAEYLYRLRSQLFAKQGRSKEALQLVDAYVAKHPGDATALNERCWIKATLNVQLDTALADCNASLKIEPDSPATLDSRAFANLRLGATDAAVADYNAALKLTPDLSASLYGRAIARARKGDEQGARADLQQARKISPDIDSRFAGFGIALPPALAGPAQAADTSLSN
jgi:tetratricopeptide (TPR) repeat protein